MACVAVLIAIAIPTFTSQLENSREATDKANLRSAYAELSAMWLTDNTSHTVTVPVQQKEADWQSEGGASKTKIGADLTADAGSGQGAVEVTAKTSGNYTLSISGTGVITEVTS